MPVIRTRYLAVIASGAARGARRRLPVDRLPRLLQPEPDRRAADTSRWPRSSSAAWRPGGALAAALLFGFSSAVAQRLPAFSESLAVLFQALPYVRDADRGGRRDRPLATAGRHRRAVREGVARMTVARLVLASPSQEARAAQRRGRALPAHLQHAAALERRDAAARARVVAPGDGLEPSPAGRQRRARPGRVPVRDPPAARTGSRAPARDHGPGRRGLRDERDRHRRAGTRRTRRRGGAAGTTAAAGCTPCCWPARPTWTT